MSGKTAETIVGAIVLAVAGGFVVYASNTADLGLGRAGGATYVAEFRKADGLAPGGDVRIAGVKVGSIVGMQLDPATFRAKVRLSIDDTVELPDDSAARITSASLLGDSYIAISPGASEFMLENGDEITYTQDAVNLLDMVGSFIHGASGDSE
ncbi:MAG: outer membrane lipid asymmetry maintenance protein MlaD [Pseudomonadota bacterium]